ncbi:MAG: class I SAM-dependent methyltransferase, partial [Acidimicrobiales bacterium]
RPGKGGGRNTKTLGRVWAEGTTPSADTEGWLEAGAAWEHAATDWAYLFEPYARDAIEALFTHLAVGPGTDLLDMACGSGYALGRAERRGVVTAGLDASGGLIEIAQRRAPEADLRVGDMFALPWDADHFDVVTSFNGVWGGCGNAFSEAFRVLRPGGAFGVTFWGPGKNLDLRNWFIALGSSTPPVGDEMIQLASIGAPGVVEDMFTDAGFENPTRGATSAILEAPDADMLWRCFRSPGLVKPALDAVGEDALRELMLATVEPFRAPDGSYRFVNELTHAVAHKPA